MYTDSHCHLTYLKLQEYTQKRDLLLAMKNNHVNRAMAIMCHVDELEDIMSWVDLSDEQLSIGMSIGVHPCQDGKVLSALTADHLLSLDSDKVWAIGETGLDYHWDDSKKRAQKSSFVAHIHASQQLKKPIVVHTRDAYYDTLDILAAERCEHGIIHCFTEDYAFAKKALDMGLYISLSGIISFKKSVDLRAVVKKLPQDRLLIETDSPYLAPVPKRGRENEPTFVPYVARALGEIINKSAQEIGQLTSSNFDNLLNQYA